MYEILTPCGFQPFVGVRRKLAKTLFLKLTNGKELGCTYDHKIWVGNRFCLAKNLKIGDLIETKDGYIGIAGIRAGKKQLVYDAIDVEAGNIYYTNDVISHNCEFLGSADTLISGAKLQQLVYIDPIYSEEYFKVYERPVAGHSYASAADTSEGVGKDYSVLSVFDVTSMPYKHVACYRNNKILPIQFAEVVNRISKHYNEAALVVEANSVGAITAGAVWDDYEYENMLTTRVKESENQVNTAGRSTPGIKTTTKTKAIGCSALKSMIEGNSLLVSDYDTISELTTFIQDKKSYAAEKGKTDDIAMTLVIFSWFAQQPYFSEMVDTNVKGLVKQNLDEVNSFAIGFFDDGTQPEVESMFLH